MILITALAAFLLFCYASVRMGDVPDAALFEDLPNFQDGKFRNLDPVKLDRKKIARKGNWLKKLTSREHFPPAEVPVIFSTPEELASPDLDFSVRWLGHASLLMEWGGLRILVDPVFGNAAPVPGIVPRYTPPPIKRDDLPPIDWVLLTHDHYDHLEYDTIRYFVRKPKTRFVVPLGVGTRLRGWGIEPERIVELNWYESTALYGSVSVTMTPGRHFSGRSLKDRDRTLWGGYVLADAKRRIYLAGDGGYGQHFAEVGKRFGPFDLVFLEIDAWNERWPNNHTFPAEAVSIFRETDAKLFFPIHWAVFDLAMHPWDESIRMMSQLAEKHQIPLVTPQLGEKWSFGIATNRWWENLTSGQAQDAGRVGKTAPAEVP